MSPAQRRRLFRCMAVVWGSTAVVSLLGLRPGAAVSLRLLADGGVTDALLASSLVMAGSVLDALIGAALWWRPGRASARVALVAMGGMTLVATALLPHLWLDPLGPLLKNLPIAAVMWLLADDEGETAQ